MTSLSKTNLEDKAAHVERLNKTYADLEAAALAFSTAVEAEQDKVQAALDAYNEAIQDANAFREEVAAESQSYYDDRAEKWQESERGEAYRGFIDEWAGSHDEATIDFPGELELPDNVAEELDGLPDEVG